MSSEWKERKRPNRLEKQYQFEDYEALRDFLDLAAQAIVTGGGFDADAHLFRANRDDHG